MTKEERTIILRNHPALAARLFELKQNCLWDCILRGKDNPIGEIVDYWRRVEVRLYKI
jgi:hypothetical protein